MDSIQIHFFGLIVQDLETVLNMCNHPNSPAEQALFINHTLQQVAKLRESGGCNIPHVLRRQYPKCNKYNDLILKVIVKVYLGPIKGTAITTGQCTTTPKYTWWDCRPLEHYRFSTRHPKLSCSSSLWSQSSCVPTRLNQTSPPKKQLFCEPVCWTQLSWHT